MRCAALEVTLVVTASFLGGCASTPGVRQAKQTDPIIVVTVQNTPKKDTDKPAGNKPNDKERSEKEAELVRVLGAMKPAEIGIFDDEDSNSVLGGVPGGVPGGIPGGVLGGPTGGFGGFGTGSGGLGLSGIGSGSGGAGQGIGIGSIGIGSRTGYGGSPSTGSSFGTRSSGSNGDRVKPKFGNVTVTGPLMIDVVQRHVDDRRNDIQGCHDFERVHTSLRWGSLTLRLHIDSTGRVDAVQVVESTLSSVALENCIAHVVGAFEFPSPGANGSVNVILPISF